jgi:hypothetical protein
MMHKSIISQYIQQNIADDSTTTGKICAYIESQNDVSIDIQGFYDTVWNIDTAQGIWLDMWGVWVGIPNGRYLNIPSLSTFFGFDYSGAGNFDRSIFYEAGNTTNNYALTDAVYRRLILLKAFANISDCSIATLNKILTTFFAGRGRAYAFDNENMTIRLNFEFTLYAWEKAIIEQSGVFPKPAGVRFIYTSLIPAKMFSFDGAGQTFDNGYMVSN